MGVGFRVSPQSTTISSQDPQLNFICKDPVSKQDDVESPRIRTWTCLLQGHHATLTAVFWHFLPQEDFLYLHRDTRIPGGSVVKNLPASAGDTADAGSIPLGREDPLEGGRATHSSTLAWRIPWTEEPGGLQFMGSQSQTRLSN